MSNKLSILICSTFDRQAMTEQLIAEIEFQIFKFEAKDSVEVLVEYDNKEISVGKKRQNLLEKAKGLYVVYIDSDDWIAPNYVDLILKAIDQKPDCITFEIRCKGTKGSRANVALKYRDWMDNQDGFHYVRMPYHKTPILRIHALQIGFKDMRFGEDYDFSKRLKQSGLLQSEVHYKTQLYIYQFKYEDFQKKYGFDKDKARNN
jgi:glycosyltransferase involved in cell wall biosynthesis